MTAEDMQVLNCSIFSNHSRKHHATLNTHGPRERRIHGLHAMEHHALSYALRNAHTLRRGCLRYSDRCIADNAADHTIHRPARGTGGEATHDASHLWRRRFFFLNHFDFLWNLRRGAKLIVDDISLDLLHHMDRRRRRRWWRRK